ncbi:MAG: peptidylprolyl isomerase [Cyanobacteriota bacterium]|nr:peptidylprolyl isomerase [Cyanobacteriota bacterium]
MPHLETITIRTCTLPICFTLLLSLVGCSKEPIASEIGCKTSRIPCLYETSIVELETERGAVVLQLMGKDAPLTAGNFADLVKRGVYNGTTFHRVIRSPSPFVVQGGDPGTADPKVPVTTHGTGNFIDPATGEARFIPLEFKLKSSHELVYGQELSASSLLTKSLLTHDRGSVAMARSADPNSASAQFYIALKPLPELDGRYAVFGKVIRGMNVVDRLQQGDKLIRAKLLTINP